MTQDSCAPSIILVEPQMAENIGAVARAMANFGLLDLRLVRPRDGWPNARAYPMAAGADGILDRARVYGSLAAALAGITRAYAATGRDRAMNKAVLSPAEAGERITATLAQGRGAALVFGAERAGLSNEDVVLCDAVLTIPTVPDFYSLNLAQAVIVCAYAWFSGAERGGATKAASMGDTRPATKEELFGL
ncbi:MAG: RNA methyltransferase, partial [Alphaproteobacteria bacterium]|nr:RNA methyltransferase [Alphaproteobacteria bacterium]